MSPPRGGRRGGGNGKARDIGHGRENGPANGNGGGRDTANRGAKKTNGQGNKRWKNSSAGEDIVPQPASQGSQETPELLYQKLKTRRVAERREAINQGLMDDPDVRRKLKDAITFRGTCLGMCPEFEKVERVVQRAVDICEKEPPDVSGKPVPERMVKEYRRSAAGNDAPLPSDVRPPHALQKTLNYLIDEILGGPLPLTKTNKFLWSRTRSIRQDFTFQNVGKSKNIHIAVDCFERICRMHILSLHQLSHPDINSGDFSHQQEQEQFFKTLTSIMHFYEDCRFQGVRCKNEAEFCAIYIIAYIQIPDIEKEAQEWPPEIFNHPRVQTALEIHATWQNIHDARGPLEKVSPPVTPDIVQNSFGRFWSLIRSSKVSYVMACVAEIHFNRVRRMALSAIVTSCKVRNVVDDWILSDLMEFLGFDDEDQVQSFCEKFGMQIKEREDGDAFLILDSAPEDPSPWPAQIFSEGLVEFKRHNRTYPAVVHGYTVRQAREMGLIKRPALNPTAPQFTLASSKADSLFVSDGEDGFEQEPKPSSNATALHTLTSFFPNNLSGSFGGLSGKTDESSNAFTRSALPAFSGRNSSFKSGAFGQAPFISTNTSSSFGKPSGILGENTAPSIFGTSSGTPGTGSFGKPSVMLNGNKLAAPTKPSGVTISKPANPFQTGSPRAQPFSSFISKSADLANSSTDMPKSFKNNFPTSSVLDSARSSPLISFDTAGSVSKTQLSPTFDLNSVSSTSMSAKHVSNAPGVFSSKPFSPFSNSSSTQPSNSTSVNADSSNIRDAPLPKTESSYGGFIVDETSSPTASVIPASAEGSPFGNLAANQGLSPSTSSSEIWLGTPAVQTTSHLFRASIVPEQPTLSQSQSQTSLSGQASLEPVLHTTPAQPPLTRSQADSTTPLQKPLPSFSFTPAQSTASLQPQYGTPSQEKPLRSFSFTPAQSTASLQPQYGTPSQQKPLPAFQLHHSASADTSPLPPPSTGLRMSPVVSASKPKSILKQNFAVASINAPGHTVSGIDIPQAPSYSSQTSLVSQTQLGKARAAGEISDELSDWFLWGEDGIYDQFFEHVFPSIEASARRQVEGEAFRREADEFRQQKLMQRYFYRWKELAYHNSIRRRGRERRARRRTTNNSQELIWTPVQYRPSADSATEEALAQAIEAKRLIYRPVPLVNIFKAPVEKALSEAKAAKGRWALFAVSSDARSDYWWQNKFGLYNGEDTDTGFVLNSTSNGLTFTAFPRATSRDLFLDTGCVIFGCSVDFSLSNAERFENDRKSLHKTMQYVCGKSRYPNIALLVICYRSPLDTTDLDFNDVDMGRCAKKGRLDRVLASREALDFKSLLPNVIGRNLVIVDSKDDLDLTPYIAPLAELVLPTVSPNLTKLRASGSPELEKRRSHHGMDELSTNRTANDTAPRPKRSDVGEHSVVSSGNSSMAERGSIKRKGSGTMDIYSLSAKSRRKGEQQLSAPSSKRSSLPSGFRSGDIFHGDLLAKWKRLRQELEDPCSKPVKTPAGRHQRSRTVGSVRVPEGQQISPRSTSSRGSSLQSGSWSQLHRGGRDKTNTDYFRLKARGIEKLPNGSVVPAAIKALPKKRSYPATYSDTDCLQRPIPKKVQVKGNMTQDASTAANPTAGGSDVEDEELFAEARKIMSTITEGIEFYREETRRVVSRSGSGERL